LQCEYNIVFVLCDDLGINDLHCYGREDHQTPHLDRLAAQGTRFTSAYASQAICSASRAGLLTGINPARRHLTTFLPGRPNATSQRVLHPEIMMHVPLSVKTFPRYFKELMRRQLNSTICPPISVSAGISPGATLIGSCRCVRHSTDGAGKTTFNTIRRTRIVMRTSSEVYTLM
jgi:hypothetical protein